MAVALYNTTAVLIGIAFLIVLPNTVFAAEYYVGGIDYQWGMQDDVPDFDYQDWADSITFYEGDGLIFYYPSWFHDVVVAADPVSFENCQMDPNLGKYDSGADTLILNGGPGTYCFMCSKYCKDYMKFCITTTS